MLKIFLVCVLFIGVCQACNSPSLTAISFTTQDSTIVTNIAYIYEFSVKCDSGSVNHLYAEVDGNIVPTSLVGSNKYQISWTEELKSARTGVIPIRIFNEDGYTAARKAIRSGEDLSTVEALINTSIHHPGAFNGPWLKSEFIATVLSVIVAYVAITSRSKLSA